MKHPEEIEWLGPRADQSAMTAFGLRLSGGGTHQSKTMMSDELDALLSTGLTNATDLSEAVITDNVLGKTTAKMRSLTYRHLTALYGLKAQPPITKTLLTLWKFDQPGRRLNALLVALARDPLLRDTARVVLNGSIGDRIHRSSFESALLEAHPRRLSEKMVRSLAQNCSSTWTQSRHLEGRVKKIRRRVDPTPGNAAFAALLAVVSGFGGPSILSSAWMRVLDMSVDQGLDLLRRAEAMGLARVRSAGDVTEILVRQPMATTLGVRELEHV